MSVILYARVSTGPQAERDLSIPAQLRALRRLVKERSWTVAGEYQDVASARTLRDRRGLLRAVQEATTNRSVDTLLVHRVDRLARNTYEYLILKSKLRRVGVRIVSIVEHLEATPMGEFLEHVMAAQAEFYSANLAMEVRKGLEERLARGRWNGPPPLGYIREHGKILPDPARAPLIRRAFERWATGTVTLQELGHELHAAGLVARGGATLNHKYLSPILKNPFYTGTMVVKGVRYPGLHQPLVSPDIFERCQEVFRQKTTGGRPRRKLTFLLSCKIPCPRCARKLVGEEHLKPSGKLYRYYRCPGCSYLEHVDELDQFVLEYLRGLRVTERAVPILKRRIQTQAREQAARVAGRVRALQEQRRQLEAERRELARRYFDNKIDVDSYDLQDQELAHGMRATDMMLAELRRWGGPQPEGDHALLETARSIDTWLASDDAITRRRAVDELVERVVVTGSTPTVALRPAWAEPLGDGISSPALCR